MFDAFIVYLFFVALSCGLFECNFYALFVVVVDSLLMILKICGL